MGSIRKVLNHLYKLEKHHWHTFTFITWNHPSQTVSHSKDQTVLHSLKTALGQKLDLCCGRWSQKKKEVFSMNFEMQDCPWRTSVCSFTRFSLCLFSPLWGCRASGVLIRERRPKQWWRLRQHAVSPCGKQWFYSFLCSVSFNCHGFLLNYIFHFRNIPHSNMSGAHTDI